MTEQEQREVREFKVAAAQVELNVAAAARKCYELNALANQWSGVPRRAERRVYKAWKRLVKAANDVEYASFMAAKAAKETER